jgi:hypothetical protein
MKTPVIRKGESKIIAFPVFDFNGQAASSNLTAGSATVTLGAEGWWAVYGISATGCIGPDGSLASGSDMNIQILDLEKNRYLFTYASNFALTGAPIEHVAGKWGNPHFLGYPWIFAPGTRLMLYASHNGQSTPTARSPLYVVLHAVLTDRPVEPATMGSFGRQMMDNQGEPYAMSTKFVFSGAAGNNFLNGQSRTNPSPINRDLDFFINSITARYSGFTQAYLNTVDPRVQELELLMNMRDSIAQSAFSQPDLVPISLMTGFTGAREFAPPTLFHVNPNADIVTTLKNGTGATITADVELTFQGSMLKRP